LPYGIRRLAHDSTMALKTFTEKRNLSARTDNAFREYGNIGRERRDAKKQARRFGGIGQAGRAQKRAAGRESVVVSISSFPE
jgi:hypothetical protein